MLNHIRSDEILVTPPSVCGFADIELAHLQMQNHRACRISRCAWKWVAYCTLVHSGRIAPQELSPRERAHQRGIDFPVADSARPLCAGGAPELQTFQHVLDGLGRLADELRAVQGDGRER